MYTQYVILNADDFGYSPDVNAAVLRAHRRGTLTSASLMVSERAWKEAVDSAQRTPTLGVGLHVVATLDHAVLSPDILTRIVNRDGRLDGNFLRVGLRYTLSRTAQRQLRRELEAQFARFAETGLPWSHLDGHQHFHLAPVVWDALLELCDAYGVHRLRIPHEELRAHFRSCGAAAGRGQGPDLNTAALFVFRLLARRNRRALQARRTLGGSPVFVCERVYGHLQSGNMGSAYLLRLLDRLRGRTNEIYFHPGSDRTRALAAAEHRCGIGDVDLQTLLDPRVRARLEVRNLFTGTYAEVESAARHIDLTGPHRHP